MNTCQVSAYTVEKKHFVKCVRVHLFRNTTESYIHLYTLALTMSFIPFAVPPTLPAAPRSLHIASSVPSCTFAHATVDSLSQNERMWRWAAGPATRRETGEDGERASETDRNG